MFRGSWTAFWITLGQKPMAVEDMIARILLVAAKSRRRMMVRENVEHSVSAIAIHARYCKKVPEVCPRRHF